jgi:hypothetical protein
MSLLYVLAVHALVFAVCERPALCRLHARRPPAPRRTADLLGPAGERGGPLAEAAQEREREARTGRAR